MTRILGLTCLLLLALGDPGFSQIDTTATIAAWNIEGFSSIPPDEARRIAEGIADLDPELIALSEVNPEHTAALLAGELNNVGAHYQVTLPEQTPSLKLAILHKVGVEVSTPVLIPGSDDNNTNLRKALAVDVRIGEFDFLLINVHLKAGRGPTPRSVRDRQCTAIAAFIAQRTSGPEQDVLVVGDYNMIPGEDQSNFLNLNPTNSLRFVSTEDLSGQFSHIDDPAVPTGKLLDGYAVSRQDTIEYIDGSLQIVPLHRARGMTLETSVTVPPSSQRSFCLADAVPVLRGKKGTMRVQSTLFVLSALAFRFSPGGAFTTFFTMSSLGQ